MPFFCGLSLSQQNLLRRIIRKSSAKLLLLVIGAQPTHSSATSAIDRPLGRFQFAVKYFTKKKPMDYTAPHMLDAVKQPAEVAKRRAVVEDGTTIVTNTPYQPLKSLKEFSCAKTLSFSNPTLIQRYAIPILSHGQPLLVRAPTGMGKTLCFLLPLVERIKYSKIGIQVCIITPTRELAIQVYEVAEKIAGSKRLRAAVAYGGQSLRRTQSPYSVADILVATPGRLLDNLRNGSIVLKSAEYLVLDEADKLLEMGFEKSIRDIKTYVNPNAKVCMFSATYHKRLEGIIGAFLPADRLYVEIQNETVKIIKQKIINMRDDDPKKETILVELLSKLDYTSSWRQKKEPEKVNFSDERGIDVVRNKIKKIANTMARQVIVLDECENLSRDAQTCLRRIMEDFPNTTFIFCTNYYNRIINPLKSRLLKFKFVARSAAALSTVAAKEGLENDTAFYESLFRKCGGDLRRCINVMQGIAPLVCDPDRQSENAVNNRKSDARRVGEIITPEQLDDFIGRIPHSRITSFMSVSMGNYKEFVDSFVGAGYSVLQLVQQMTEHLSGTEMQKCAFSLLIAECEGYCLNGCSDELVLTRLCIGKMEIY